jgi:hypothetical protein
MAIRSNSVIAILRIFDIAKADEFSLDVLGFKVDRDHRFDENAPPCGRTARATRFCI